jgi:hypothetical protein
MQRALIVAGLLLCCATAASAQQNQFTTQGSVFGATLGYARSIGDDLSAGLEIGAGLPQFDRTLRPEQDAEGNPDFEGLAHVAVFLRFATSERFEVDAGLRTGIADLWPCLASDCWPDGFWGAHLQPMVGWRRLKLGSRLVIGRSHDVDSPDESGPIGVVALTPLVVRLTVSW